VKKKKKKKKKMMTFVGLLEMEESAFEQWKYEIELGVFKNHEWPCYPDEQKLAAHCSEWPHFMTGSVPQTDLSRLRTWHSVMHEVFDPVFKDLEEWHRTHQPQALLQNTPNGVSVSDDVDIQEMSNLAAKRLWLTKSPELLTLIGQDRIVVQLMFGTCCCGIARYAPPLNQ
jgi:hypothetical protein